MRLPTILSWKFGKDELQLLKIGEQNVFRKQKAKIKTRIFAPANNILAIYHTLV